MTVRIAIAGAHGRMGRAVAHVLAERPGVRVTLEFDREDAPDLSLCDVVIDFSAPEASASLAERAAALPAPPALVIGSTGFDPGQIERIGQAARTIAIVRSGNFSLGINVLTGLVRQAAARLSPEDWDIEVVEAHHRRKRDAPSGTALMLGEAAAQGRGATLAGLRLPPHDGIEEAERPTGGIGFAVVRGGGVVGEHQVLFAGADETVTLSHSAGDRRLFARGAVTAALWAAGKPPGLYDMQAVLGF